jgi:Two-component sensor kinase N-terminal
MTPRSLRMRLIVAVTLSTALLLMLVALLLDGVIAAALSERFDEALLGKARSLIALIEHTDEGIEFEVSELPAAVVAQIDRDDAYQLWGPDGATLARSAALAAQRP